MNIGSRTIRTIEILAILGSPTNPPLSADTINSHLYCNRKLAARPSIDGTKAILGKLQKNGILKSTRGAHGGYSLTRELKDITLQQLEDVFCLKGQTRQSVIGAYIDSLFVDLCTSLTVENLLRASNIKTIHHIQTEMNMTERKSRFK